MTQSSEILQMPEESPIQTERPPHRGIKKGLYVIPTMFTAANVGMGFLAVIYSMRGFQIASTPECERYQRGARSASNRVAGWREIEGPLRVLQRSKRGAK